MTSLKQWRVALESTDSDHKFYHAEMMNLLEAGESEGRKKEKLIRKLQTIETLTMNSDDVRGLHYLAESALEEVGA